MCLDIFIICLTLSEETIDFPEDSNAIIFDFGRPIMQKNGQICNPV